MGIGEVKENHSMKKPGNRFSLFFAVLGLYLLLSFLVRISFLIWSFHDLVFAPGHIIRAFIMGFLFDLTAGLCFLGLYALYLLLFPKWWIGSILDKAFTYFYFAIVLFIIYFSLIAEYPFWNEFGVRFNFIAVDYLIYTEEVVSNINQSYPMPLIFAVLFLLIAGTFFFLSKFRIFRQAFSSKMKIGKRAFYSVPALLITFLLLFFLKNEQANFSNNLVTNELGKNGTFSFFAAFRSNELNYNQFYPKINDREAYSVLKNNLLQNNQTYVSNQWDNILRNTKGGNEIRPNIILVTIESFSADFLKAFGNTKNLTPFYDSIANQSIFFTDLYATGTRTIRGMEALTLSVPPTPGNSIVRRPNNHHLYSIATILKQKGYQMDFIYGGDGYFDNMNNFFSGQGFDIVDRNRRNILSDNLETHRYNIPDKDVTFENAWGVCDEDLYTQSLKYADISSKKGKPFFQFLMTTSNHRPFTFPAGKIEQKEGTRDAAVRYTDYALQNFIEQVKTKPWFDNTVFIVVADHCAGSAGVWEINIDQHHIPAIIFNLHQPPQRIDRLTSQIDLMPTLFGYLNWNYQSEFYGKDINQTKPGDERAFVGNYRTLGLLKENIFTQVDDRREVKQFNVGPDGKTTGLAGEPNKELSTETISYYQTASERFKEGKMKERH